MLFSFLIFILHLFRITFNFFLSGEYTILLYSRSTWRARECLCIRTMWLLGFPTSAVAQTFAEKEKYKSTHALVFGALSRPSSYLDCAY